jgi:hypothetical protein
MLLLLTGAHFIFMLFLLSVKSTDVRKLANPSLVAIAPKNDNCSPTGTKTSQPPNIASLPPNASPSIEENDYGQVACFLSENPSKNGKGISEAACKLIIHSLLKEWNQKTV